jgi:hypothetical protein
MTRHEKVLLGLDLRQATAIEIGALDSPIIPPTTPGVFYVDHVDTPSLREKYRSHANVNTDNLVHVNGIWGEKSLAEAAASVAPVDCLIASHVIEHVPDLVTWLKEVAAVLKPTGDLRLVIPDRRYTFDLLRSETVLADVLTAYLVRARIPQVRQVIDYIANAVPVNCHDMWEGTVDRTTLVKSHATSDIELLARDVLDNQRYHDVHCWVFTPASFTQLMMRLAELGYHTYKCVKLFDTEPYTLEFVVIAQPGADKAEAVESWKVLYEGLAGPPPAMTPEDVAAAMAARDDKIERLQAQVAGLLAAVDEIKRTASWRITAPLRAVKGLLLGR